MGTMREAPEGILVEIGSATACFPNRRALPDGPSLDIALDSPGRDAAVKAVLSAGSAGERITMGMNQQHGRDAQMVDPSRPMPDCDGLISSSAEFALVALAADCVPIALAQGQSVAVVHAGWRGLAAGVIQRSLEVLGLNSGGGPVSAAVGPSARVCCYEVSSEVVDALGPHASAEGRMVDTGKTAAAILSAAGVVDLTVMDACTICGSPERYFSFRTEGSDAGRQGVVAWLNR